jgi:hypothetical protein
MNKIFVIFVPHAPEYAKVLLSQCVGLDASISILDWNYSIIDIDLLCLHQPICLREALYV